jgi:glutaminyl-tRNA synthetase
LHWVSKSHAIPVELRLYDRLFKVENPAAEEGDFKDYINTASLEIVKRPWRNPPWVLPDLMNDISFFAKVIFVWTKKVILKNRFLTGLSV